MKETHAHSGFEHATLTTYIIGFVVSIILTLTAYILVVNEYLPKASLVGTIISIAILQALVQLFYFLRMGTEPKPQFNALIFAFMALVLVIIVFGSLWIMYNLEYNMSMLPRERGEH